MCVKISKNELQELWSFSNEECGGEINREREKKGKKKF